MQQLLQWIIIKYYIFWLCICSLRYTPSNAHGPYCHLGRVRLYIIIPHYRIKDRIFGKKMLMRIKFVFWFSLKLLSETVPILRRIERDMIKNVHWSSFKIQILIQFEFSRQIFEKYSNFMKIRPVVAEFVQADRRTYRHDGTNSRFSKFFERA